MKSRFKLDNLPQAPVGPEFVEPDSICEDAVESESYDAGEQRFAVSLEEAAVNSPRFVVEDETSRVRPLTDDGRQRPKNQIGSPADRDLEIAANTGPPRTRQRLPQEMSAVDDLLPPGDGNSWRQEVADRLSNYKARRRPRAPRYPSLELKFENNPYTVALRSAGPSVAVTRSSADFIPAKTEPQASAMSRSLAEPTARIIEFPRSSTTPPTLWEELAEPVLDRPRIMEAPEIAPAAPALGGILIERAEMPSNERRPGFEIPLQAAKMTRRLAAVAIDGFIVLLALSLFSYIFWLVTATIPATRLVAVMAAMVGGTLWTAYQYILTVHCATTPGLRIARLQLSCFEGSPVSRKIRRWRVIASLLSGLSLGLGYAWCFLDEDRLCWHDRITRTYMAPSDHGSGSVSE